MSLYNLILNMALKVLILIFEITLSAIGYSLIAPLFPQIAHEAGINDMTLGVIFSSFAVANCMIIPFSSCLIKVVGRKKLLYFALFLEV